jgi:hypothetical protein
MDKVGAAFKAAFLRVPFLILLTAITFACGHQFMHDYWDTLGLPLMSASSSVNDTLLNGYAGLLLWISPALHSGIDPTAIVILASAALVLSRLAARSVWVRMLRRRRVRRRLDSVMTRDRRKSFRRFARFAHEYERFAKISLPALSAVVVLFSILFIITAPVGYAGKMGRQRAAKQLSQGRVDLQSLKDRLVDVSSVTYTKPNGADVGMGVPLNCDSERCALLTTDGPLAIAKSRILDEYVERAELPPSCFTASGIAKRRLY